MALKQELLQEVNSWRTQGQSSASLMKERNKRARTQPQGNASMCEVQDSSLLLLTNTHLNPFYRAY